MEESVARYLRSKGVCPGYQLQVKQTIRDHPALQCETNGFNNAHEAVRHLQTALVHLLIARKNGELDEVVALQGAIDCSVSLIDDVTDMHHELYLSRTADLKNMAARFQRVWRAVELSTPVPNTS
jgi:hypothetical protein